MRIYREVTDDHGCAMRVGASDNCAEYILTSAMAKDMRNDYLRKYDRIPSAAWYRRHFRFKRVK